ncbi:hypothetical protein [Muribaculum intestinale]|jgi:hypothetical protein|uniref:Uncharacterized protein n=2 Tax=Muribaculum intestinale TaxID=1796646 RepID=A0A4S2FR01_9BACT|nr:hypothetical protein [Muribaculum intestinale]MYM13554.1 hypothetical protein [Muribaculum intestinale]QQR08088.1 hypothetical protein I5Q90_08580 [Muribaculum intestinale]TGY71607.1 hypothetical protein E5333_11180 [Muribaculum intestinale]GFI67635.1 hypothetical protein IMSAG192_01167 [Muribaculaceae bacterium]
MVTLLLPAAVSASFLSCVAGVLALVILILIAMVRRSSGQMTTLGGGVIALLSVIAIGVIWIVAVSPVDMVWSVAGMRESADLIGSGTSVQRSLGYTYGHDALVPRGVAVWLAVIISAVVVMSVWIAISILGRRRRLAPPRPSVKNESL